MRISRANAVLAGVLAVLVALSWALERPGIESAPDRPLFPELVPREVARVRVEEAGSGGVELVRGEAGWSVAELFGFPALGWAVDELLDRVAALSSAQRVADRAASHASFGVGDGGRRVVLTRADGTLLAAFVQGAPPAATARAGVVETYVRPAQSDEVFLAPGLAPVELDPRRWMASRMLAFEPASARRLAAEWDDAEGERRRVEIEADAGGVWRAATVEAREAPAAEVRALLELAGSLYCTGVAARGVGAEHGLVPRPALALVCELDGGEALELWVGGPAGEGERYATVRGWSAPWVVRLPEASAAELEAALAALETALSRGSWGR